jgi:Bacteriocin-protection, YdeI or OmpD-Associated/Domain of unknown function (DUF1905)
MKIQFKAYLMLAGKTATGFVVPPEVMAQLNEGKKPPVKVTIKGYTFRTTVAVYGGECMIGISAENRKSANVLAGELMEIQIESDKEPRIADVPPDFKELLYQEPSALNLFESLSYSRKQGILLPIRDAKTNETRTRRMQKALESLLAGKA